jgi:hypothetical protein
MACGTHHTKDALLLLDVANTCQSETLSHGQARYTPPQKWMLCWEQLHHVHTAATAVQTAVAAGFDLITTKAPMTT